jgi:hypothetical protein
MADDALRSAPPPRVKRIVGHSVFSVFCIFNMAVSLYDFRCQQGVIDRLRLVDTCAKGITVCLLFKKGNLLFDIL